MLAALAIHMRPAVARMSKGTIVGVSNPVGPYGCLLSDSKVKDLATDADQNLLEVPSVHC